MAEADERRTLESTAEGGESEPSDGGESLTIGDRELLEGYTDFRKELEALPDAAEFQALVLKYGQLFGYRAVGRWIVGRAPKPKAKS